MTIENCNDFIRRSRNLENELHLAVVDENDNYDDTDFPIEHMNNKEQYVWYAVRAKDKELLLEQITN